MSNQEDGKRLAIFGVLETYLPMDASSPLQKIDLKKFQKIVEEMTLLNNQIETIRKCNNSTLSNCQKAANLIGRLEESLIEYQIRLRDLFSNTIGDFKESNIKVEPSGLKQQN